MTSVSNEQDGAINGGVRGERQAYVPVSDERLAQMLDSARRLEIPEWVSAFSELLALRSQSPESSSSEVRVKPLEWVDNVASTPFGDYWIIVGFDSRVTLGVPKWSGSELKKYPTADAAKAAAQADYEQCIRSALEPTLSQPGTGEEVEVMAWKAMNTVGAVGVFSDRQKANEWAEDGEGHIEPLVRLSDYQALQARLSAVEGAASTHRHKKRGTEYVLIGIGKMQAGGWYQAEAKPDMTGENLAPIDYREVVIYRSATEPTEIWVRPREEFEDGRFEALATITGGDK